MKYKVLKNILAPRPIIEGDGGTRGISRGESAEIYWPGALIDIPEDKVLEQEGFVEKVSDKSEKKKGDDK